MAKLVPELLVSDFARSLAFYTELIGFSVLYGRLEDGFAYLDREGAQIMLEQRDPRSARNWVAGVLERPYGRGMNLEIDVSAVASVYDACKANGAPIFLDIEEKWYRRDRILLGVRQFIVLDPDGYLLRFSQSIGQKPVSDER